MKRLSISGLFLMVGIGLLAQVTPPESLVLDGIPPVPDSIRTRAAQYLEFRTASLGGWHPSRKEILITTRFAETLQLHRVTQPMGAREQLTFSSEPVSSPSWQPRKGSFIVYSQDVGGGEFYQLYRFDPAHGQSTLLTDGKSRNMGARWSRSGRWLAYTSTRRNGRDSDIRVMDPAKAETDRLACEVSGGGWRIEDWSGDESRLLVVNQISINKSDLYLLDIRSGQLRQITPLTTNQVAYSQARFGPGDASILVVTDRDAEFGRLHQFDAPPPGAFLDRPRRTLTAHIPWDIDSIDLAPNGAMLAFVANENGRGALHLLNTRSWKEEKLPPLPAGVLANVQWHEDSRHLAFTLSSARAPADVYSIDTRQGRLERWTRSETGGLNADRFSEPEFVSIRSFDGLEFSTFLYRPEASRFPGRRPALINIHGGPEGQARPGFQTRNNFFINELGIVLVVPNVRGSTGYGKSFLAADNGFKREDSVRDIGALIARLKADPAIDPDRIAVTGGSYGGYMVLASLVHHGDQLRCGIDIVGISNFLTFLKNTQDYRRDLRRVEYGDERDPAMAALLASISPTAHVDRIHKPLLVVQGKNDPRVPVTEAEQMVKAVRERGGTAWYLMAQDEGHGFAKKRNADFQFLATIHFLQSHLLN